MSFSRWLLLFAVTFIAGLLVGYIAMTVAVALFR